MAVYLRAPPNYVNNLIRLGFGEDDFADGGSDRLVDAIVACGDVNTTAERVQAHFDAGASPSACRCCKMTSPRSRRRAARPRGRAQSRRVTSVPSRIV